MNKHPQGNIEVFDREYFESILPKNKKTKRRLWEAKVEWGEWVYYIWMNDPHGARIKVRSSIASDTDWSDGSGQNSIRIWLVNQFGKPIQKKKQAYVTRRLGWEKRMWKLFSEIRQERQKELSG